MTRTIREDIVVFLQILVRFPITSRFYKIQLEIINNIKNILKFEMSAEIEMKSINTTDNSVTNNTAAFNPFSLRITLIYVICFINFVSLAITIVSVLSIVNIAINGDENVNSSASALVNTTVYFLINVSDLIFAKYNSSLSDFVGRKPMLLISQLSLLVSRLLILLRQETSSFYVAAVIYGFGNYFYNVCLAWLCDLLIEVSVYTVLLNHESQQEDRGKAFGLLIGLSIGFGFTIGLPVGAVLCITDPYLPVRISIALSCINCVIIVALPLCDTIACKSRMLAQSDKPDIYINPTFWSKQ